MANEPITREEIMLSAVATGESANLEPITREEMFLAKLGGQDVETPEPITRREKLLQGIIDNGGGGTKVEGTIAITENGTYDVAAYANADVNVESAGGGDIDALIDGSITEITSNAIVQKATFNGFVALKTGVMPKLLETRSQGLQGCVSLEYACFDSLEKINTYSFQRGSSLKKLVLRKNVVCALSNANAFGDCYHILGTKDNIYNPNGDKDGFIYVPRALVDSYKSATNWSTYASQFRALEDYTVDGTTTGELDESKI